MASTTVVFKDFADADHSFVLLPVLGSTGRRIDVTASTPTLQRTLDTTGAVVKPNPTRKFSALRTGFTYSEVVSGDVPLWGVSPIAAATLSFNVPFGAADGNELLTVAQQGDFVLRALAVLVQALRGFDGLTTGEISSLSGALLGNSAMGNALGLVAQGDR